MTILEKSFSNYQKMLDLINENANENGIAYFDRQYIDEYMNLGRTKTNLIIRELNCYEEVITRHPNNGFSTKYKEITEIKWIQEILILFMETMEDPELIKKGDHELMQQFNIDRRIVQKYRAYITMGNYTC